MSDIAYYIYIDRAYCLLCAQERWGARVPPRDPQTHLQICPVYTHEVERFHCTSCKLDYNILATWSSNNDAQSRDLSCDRDDNVYYPHRFRDLARQTEKRRKHAKNYGATRSLLDSIKP